MKKFIYLLQKTSWLLLLIHHIAPPTIVADTWEGYDDFEDEWDECWDSDDEEYAYDEYFDHNYAPKEKSISSSKAIGGLLAIGMLGGSLYYLYNKSKNQDENETHLIDAEDFTSITIKDNNKTLSIPIHSETEKVSSISISNRCNYPGDNIVYTKYSPDGEWLVVATKRKNNTTDLYLYEVDKNEWTLLQGAERNDPYKPRESFTKVAFSKKSDYIAAYGEAGQDVYAWETSTKKLVVAHCMKHYAIYTDKGDDEEKKWTWKIGSLTRLFVHDFYYDEKGTLNLLFFEEKRDNNTICQLKQWSLPALTTGQKNIGYFFDQTTPTLHSRSFFEEKEFKEVTNEFSIQCSSNQYRFDEQSARLIVNSCHNYIALINNPLHADNKLQYIDVWKDSTHHLSLAIKGVKNLFFCGEKEEVLGIHTSEDLFLVNLDTKQGTKIEGLTANSRLISGAGVYFQHCESVNFQEYDRNKNYRCGKNSKSKQQHRLDIYQLTKNNISDSIGYTIEKVAKIPYNQADRIISKELHMNIEEYYTPPQQNKLKHSVYEFSINPTNWEIKSIKEIVAGKLLSEENWV